MIGIGKSSWVGDMLPDVSTRTATWGNAADDTKSCGCDRCGMIGMGATSYAGDMLPDVSVRVAPGFKPSALRLGQLGALRAGVLNGGGAGWRFGDGARDYAGSHARSTGMAHGTHESGADESTYTGGSAGSNSSSGGDSTASGTTTYSDRGYYMADDSWDSEHLWILDKAFDQINLNIDIVEEYFLNLVWDDLWSRSGDCVQKLLTGGSLFGGKLHIKRASLGEEGVSGTTVKGSVYIRLEENYVRAVANSRKLESCGSGNGDCNCIVADLSGLIIHETTHSCLSGEKMAYLLGQWWRWQYGEKYGYTSTNCCANSIDPEDPAGGLIEMELVSWDPDDWTKAGLNAKVWLNGWSHSRGDEWRLNFCVAHGAA